MANQGLASETALMKGARRRCRGGGRRMRIAILLAVWCVICGGSVRADELRTLRMLYWQAPAVFNPHLTPAAKDMEVCRIVYEPLATPAIDGTLIPVLAAEIPSKENGGVSADGAAVTWRLKRNVKWSDGRPFTSDDVRFTWEFIRNAGAAASHRSVYETVESVEAPDRFTVRVRFRHAAPDWRAPFTGPHGMILPRHVFDSLKHANVKDMATLPARVGTGPFRMTRIDLRDTILVGEDVVHMVRIILEVNPFFRETGKPGFDRIVIRGGGGAAATARDVLMDGAADFAWNLQMDESRLSQMSQSPYGIVVSVPTSLVEMIVFNFSAPVSGAGAATGSGVVSPVADVNVRRAVAHAVNRDAVAALYGRRCRPVDNVVLLPAHFVPMRAEWIYPYDLERAAALLDAAGWRDSDGDGVRDKNGAPLKLSFHTSVNPIRQKTQRIVRDALRAIGVSLDLKMIDASVFFSGNAGGDLAEPPNMWEYAHGNTGPDPGAYLRSWRCPATLPTADGSGAFRNPGRYCNPEYDALRPETAAADPERRRTLLMAMNDLLVKDVAVIPLVQRTLFMAVGRDLQGVDLTPWDRSTWNIADWRRRRSVP